MGNRHSNAPGFGNGGGKLKNVVFKTKKAGAIFLPGVVSGPERGDSITKGGRAAGLTRRSRRA